MVRLVISTVGTSLLTNQIDREYESRDYTRLRDTANCNTEEVEKHHEDVETILQTLKERAEEKLNGDIDAIREASAELNGIYGIYDKEIERGKEDTHLLITTDTAQGLIAAELIENFLKNQGLKSTSTYYTPGFSLNESTTFAEGIANLFTYIQDEIITPFKNKQYTICFNLVGSFKAIQGYFNTIGMFYADEIVYVFEGSDEVIRIPKLPVKVNKSMIEPYKVQLAMMDVGDVPKSWQEAEKVPLDWILVDGQDKTLSTWGKLLWNQCSDFFLSQDKPLDFPCIHYEPSFLDDYKNDRNKKAEDKINLQKTLARCSGLILKNTDGISALRTDGIIRLRKYEGKHKTLDHFDLPKDRRVSCLVKNGTLHLRHYGEHDYVNNNP